MRLYLVQHGEAHSKDVNPERPLTEKGRQDTERTAVFAHGAALRTVDEIIHSGKTRALQTADILASHLRPAHGVSEEKNLDPDDDVTQWAEKISGMDRDIVIVGHLPHLGHLASYLLCGNPTKNIVKFRNSGIICLGRDGGSWSLQWMIIPQMLA